LPIVWHSDGDRPGFHKQGQRSWDGIIVCTRHRIADNASTSCGKPAETCHEQKAFSARQLRATDIHWRSMVFNYRSRSISFRPNSCHRIYPSSISKKKNISFLLRKMISRVHRIHERILGEPRSKLVLDPCWACWQH
jgi:hypothetical protein